jgi:hypothetical protein
MPAARSRGGSMPLSTRSERPADLCTKRSGGQGWSRLTAMIARWTLSSISGQSELWTTLHRFRRYGSSDGVAPRPARSGRPPADRYASASISAHRRMLRPMAGGSGAEHSSSWGALAERQQLSRRSKRDRGATIRPRRRYRHADCTQTGGGNPRRRITISRLLRGAP